MTASLRSTILAMTRNAVAIGVFFIMLGASAVRADVTWQAPDDGTSSFLSDHGVATFVVVSLIGLMGWSLKILIPQWARESEERAKAHSRMAETHHQLVTEVRLLSQAVQNMHEELNLRQAQADK